MKKKSTGRGVYQFKGWLDKRVQWLSNISVTRRFGIIVNTLSKFTNVSQDLRKGECLLKSLYFCHLHVISLLTLSSIATEGE